VKVKNPKAAVTHVRPRKIGADLCPSRKEGQHDMPDLFLHQQGLDTTTPAGKAMFQMMGVFAEFERSMIQERVRAGLRRVKDEGKRLGRPRIAPELETRILEALKAGGTVRGVADKFKVNPSTVQRIKHPFDAAAA
jgi:DNA invertase Pin-like site-specific DNA recombinase